MEIQGKLTLVRVGARFELARVRVIGSQLYILSPLLQHERKLVMKLVLKKNKENVLVIYPKRYFFNSSCKLSRYNYTLYKYLLKTESLYWIMQF